MQLTSQTEEQLKRLKGHTGITPNISARLAFFRSIESGFHYEPVETKLDGTLVLDKVTWLGDTALATELLLKSQYPNLEAKDLMRAWAAHVEDGISGIRNHRSLIAFSLSIQ